MGPKPTRAVKQANFISMPDSRPTPGTNTHPTQLASSRKDNFTQADQAARDAMSKVLTLGGALDVRKHHKKHGKPRTRRAVFKYIPIAREIESKTTDVRVPPNVRRISFGIQLPENAQNADKSNNQGNSERPKPTKSSPIKFGVMSTPELPMPSKELQEAYFGKIKTEVPAINMNDIRRNTLGKGSTYGQVTNTTTCTQIFSSVRRATLLQNSQQSTLELPSTPSAPPKPEDLRKLYRRQSANNILDFVQSTKVASPTNRRLTTFDNRSISSVAAMLSSPTSKLRPRRSPHRSGSQKNVAGALLTKEEKEQITLPKEQKPLDIKEIKEEKHKESPVIGKPSKRRATCIDLHAPVNNVQNHVNNLQGSPQKDISPSRKSLKEDYVPLGIVRMTPIKVDENNVYTPNPRRERASMLVTNEIQTTSRKKDNLMTTTKREISPKDKQIAKTTKQDTITEALNKKHKGMIALGKDRNSGKLKTEKISDAERRHVWKGEKGAFNKDRLVDWYRCMKDNY